MRVIVLGSAAGGGFPQWNCRCRNCEGVRRGAIRSEPRTQSSIALSFEGERGFILVNASPDLRTQLTRLTACEATDVRESPIRHVLLTDAQIDHAYGLPLLREGPRLSLWTTAEVKQDLERGLGILGPLSSFSGFDWHDLGTKRRTFALPDLPRLEITVLPLTAKPPRYSTHAPGARSGHSTAFLFRDAESRKSLLYAPQLTPGDSPLIAEVFALGVDLLLVEGSFFYDDELARIGASSRTALEMGHWPLGGSDGLVERLSPLPSTRKILVHINNTNPILDEDSSERKMVERAGIEVGRDGMEIDL